MKLSRQFFGAEPLGAAISSDGATREISDVPEMESLQANTAFVRVFEEME